MRGRYRASWLQCGMGDANHDGEGSGLVESARVMVRCSVRCMVRVGLLLSLGYASDVRTTKRIYFWVTVKHG